MAKDPAFLFYYQDFLVGTDHMTDEQIGQYVKCLCHQANRGTIREEHMKNICKTHDNHMIIIEKFINDENGEYFNKRLRYEVERRKNYAESRRNNRKKKDMNNICYSYDKHMENETENIIEVSKASQNTVKRTKIEVSNNNNDIYNGGASEGLARSMQAPSQGAKDKDKDKAKDKAKDKYLECVYLTKDEHRKLVEKFGQIGTDSRIRNLNDGIMSKGYKYVSHYHTILNWDRRDQKDNPGSKTMDQF